MKILTISSPKYGLFECLLDDEDYDRLKEFNWCVRKDYKDKRRNIFYAVRRAGSDHRKQKMAYIHREICPQWAVVDHVNGNRLDNRKENLRDGTEHNSKNSSIRSDNTSGFKGVSWYKRDKTWRAYIFVDHKREHLGYFDDLVEAAKAYDKAALLYYGEYAKLNGV